MKKFIVVLIVFLTVNNIYGQNVHSKITILSGGSVFFPFNSYKKMDGGMQYLNWTKLRILYFDTADVRTPLSQTYPELTSGSHWKLSVKANTANIVGDGSTNIDLDRVVIVTSATTDDGTIAYTTPHTLTNGDFAIVSNGANATGTSFTGMTNYSTEVLITYEVGYPPNTHKIIGQKPGYYFVDLIFTLEKGP